MEFGVSDWFAIWQLLYLFVKGTPFLTNTGCCNIIQGFHPKVLRMRKLISWIIQFLYLQNLPKKLPLHSSLSQHLVVWIHMSLYMHAQTHTKRKIAYQKPSEKRQSLTSMLLGLQILERATHGRGAIWENYSFTTCDSWVMLFVK